MKFIKFVFIFALVLICVGTILVMNISNATYFKTHDGVVLAYADKSLLSVGRKKYFSALTIGTDKGFLFDYFDHFYIKFRSGNLIDLAEPLDVDQFDVASEDEVYKPISYPDNVVFYTHPDGPELIVDEENNVLRVAISTKMSDSVFIGTDAANLKEFPLSIADIREMFGVGDWYNKFNM